MLLFLLLYLTYLKANDFFVSFMWCSNVGQFVFVTSGTESKSLQGALKSNITRELKEESDIVSLVKNSLHLMLIIKAATSVKFILRETLKHAFAIKVAGRAIMR